jgi:hypothetical protein
MVERALVTLTEIVTILLEVGVVGLMTGVPITGGCEGEGAWARAIVPTVRARAKNSIDRLRMEVMPVGIIREGELDFGAVTIYPRNA